MIFLKDATDPSIRERAFKSSNIPGVSQKGLRWRAGPARGLLGRKAEGVQLSVVQVCSGRSAFELAAAFPGLALAILAALRLPLRSGGDASEPLRLT